MSDVLVEHRLELFFKDSLIVLLERLDSLVVEGSLPYTARYRLRFLCDEPGLLDKLLPRFLRQLRDGDLEHGPSNLRVEIETGRADSLVDGGDEVWIEHRYLQGLGV